MKNIIYALIVSFLVWTTLMIIDNPPTRTTMHHIDWQANIEPYTLSGQVSKIINHEKVIWQSEDLTLELYLIGVYVPTKYRVETKQLLRTLLLNKQVNLEFDKQQRDRFGNYYGYIYLEDQMINGLLIRQGLAKSAVVPPNDRYSSKFLQWEIDAKNNKFGMWSKFKTQEAEPKRRKYNVL